MNWNNRDSRDQRSTLALGLRKRSHLRRARFCLFCGIANKPECRLIIIGEQSLAHRKTQYFTPSLPRTHGDFLMNWDRAFSARSLADWKSGAEVEAIIEGADRQHAEPFLAKALGGENDPTRW